MKSSVMWHGSQKDALDLVNCLAHNCDCQFGAMGVRTSSCAAHRMLEEDQRALDGLLFARYIAPRLTSEEFLCQPIAEDRQLTRA